MKNLVDYINTSVEGEVSNKEILKESNNAPITLVLELESHGRNIRCHGKAILNDITKKNEIEEFAAGFENGDNVYEFWGDYNDRATKKLIDNFLKIK